MERMMINKLNISIDIELLKKLRAIEKHTQESLALVLELSTRQIKRIEKKGDTSLKTAKLLCDEFSIELDQLIGKKPINKIFPHYWCNISTSAFNSNDDKEIYNKAGNVFDCSYDLVNFITNNIDKYFPETFLSPCKSQVIAELSQNQNKWTLQIESTQEDREVLLFEFIPFRFTDNGMEWTDYCPVDNKWLQKELIDGLFKHVSDYVTPKLPKVKDHFYFASIYIELLPIEIATFTMQQRNQVMVAQHAVETTDNLIPDQQVLEKIQEYMRANQAGSIAQFWFKEEEDLVGFILSVIRLYCPENIETELGQLRFVPTGSFNPDCRAFSIKLSRRSEGENRQIPWPIKHQELLQQKFVEYSNEFGDETPSNPLILEQLKDIAQMYGHSK